MKCPCISCEKKGCGAFHDECTAYQEWKVKKDKSRRPIGEFVKTASKRKADKELKRRFYR